MGWIKVSIYTGMCELLANGHDEFVRVIHFSQSSRKFTKQLVISYCVNQNVLYSILPQAIPTSLVYSRNRSSVCCITQRRICEHNRFNTKPLRPLIPVKFACFEKGHLWWWERRKLVNNRFYFVLLDNKTSHIAFHMAHPFFDTIQTELGSKSQGSDPSRGICLVPLALNSRAAGIHLYFRKDSAFISNPKNSVYPTLSA